MKNTLISTTTIIKEVKPAFVAQLCPRCRGYKTVSFGKIPCDMCSQTGYLKIPIKDDDEVHDDVREE